MALSRSESHRSGAAARAVAAIAVTLLGACLVLTGCAGPATPTPTPTVSRSVSATPSATKTASAGPRVVIDGRHILVYGASGSPLTLTYAVDPQSAAQQISTALGEKADTTTVTDDACYPQLAESSWGGLHIWSANGGLTRPENAQFYVTADAATTGTGINIVIPSGQGVGAARAQVLAANSSSPSFADSQAIDLHYDIVSGSASGDANQYYGALAKIVGSTLAQIDAPIYFSRPC